MNNGQFIPTAFMAATAVQNRVTDKNHPPDSKFHLKLMNIIQAISNSCMLLKTYQAIDISWLKILMHLIDDQ